MWDETIGTCYVETVLEYSAPAYFKGLADLVLPLPADDDFNQVMTRTVYCRFLRLEAPGSAFWVSDFTAMELITPIPGTYCAPVVCRFLQDGDRFGIISIAFL